VRGACLQGAPARRRLAFMSLGGALVTCWCEHAGLAVPLPDPVITPRVGCSRRSRVGVSTWLLI
jgi:hypothetical protein